MHEFVMCFFTGARMPAPEMVAHPALSAGGIGEMIQRFRHQGAGTITPTSEATGKLSTSAK